MTCSAAGLKKERSGDGSGGGGDVQDDSLQPLLLLSALVGLLPVGVRQGQDTALKIHTLQIPNIHYCEIPQMQLSPCIQENTCFAI